MIINKLILIFTAAAMGFTSFGAPLDKKNVGGDAQWLAQLDFENLKNTKMGAFLLARVCEEIAKNNDSPISIDVGLFAEELHSLTAYGSDISEDPQKIAY